MKTLELDKATKPLSHFVRRARRNPLIVTSNGIPLIVLVAIPNTDSETASLSNSVKFLSLIARSRTRLRRDGGLSSESLRARLHLTKKSGTRRLIGKRTSLTSSKKRRKIGR